METSLLYNYIRSLEKRIDALEERIKEEKHPNHSDELMDATEYNRKENIEQAELGGP